MLKNFKLDSIGIKTGKPLEVERDTYKKSEVAHWLHFVRNDQWYLTQMPITMKNLSLSIGNSAMGRNDIYDHIINQTSDNQANNLVQKIGAMMHHLEVRDIAFYKPKKAGQEYRHIWLDKPQQAPQIMPLVLEEEWSLFAQCMRCQKNKFMPIKMNGRGHACCYRCIPPSQYRSIGGKLEKKSMIRDSLVKMGLI